MALCVYRVLTQIYRSTVKDKRNIKFFPKSLIWKWYADQDFKRPILEVKKIPDCWQTKSGYKLQKTYFKEKSVDSRMGLERLFFKRKEIMLSYLHLFVCLFICLFVFASRSFSGFAKRHGERPEFAQISPRERRESSYILGRWWGRDVKKRDPWPRGTVEGTDQHCPEGAHDSGKRPSFDKGILR